MQEINCLLGGSPQERYQPIPLDWMTGLTILLSILHQSHRIEVEYGIWVFSAPQAYLGLLLVVAIFVRLVLLQRILKDVHCAFLPLVLALSDIWFPQR